MLLNNNISYNISKSHRYHSKRNVVDVLEIAIITNEAIRNSHISISLAQQNKVVFIFALLKVFYDEFCWSHLSTKMRIQLKIILKTLCKQWDMVVNLLSAEKCFDFAKFQFVFMGHYPIMQQTAKRTNS